GQELPIVARSKLGAVDDLVDGRDGGNEQTACERSAKQFGLGFGACKCLDQQFEALVLGQRLLPTDQQLGIGQPVFVARCLVAKTLGTDPLHQPAREWADSRSKQVEYADIAILRWPDQADGQGPNPHAAGETLELLGV